MSNRRSLIQGIHPEEEIDPDLAEDFIAGKPLRRAAAPAPSAVMDTATLPQESPPPLPLPAVPAIAPPAQAAVSSPLTGVGRVPVGARVRTELAAALKRASLERQLRGIQPNTVQEIIEEALELWLHKHGLLW
jgi:hypothetical protein